MKQTAVIFLMTIWMPCFSQIKDAIKEIITKKEVQSTVVKAVEKKIDAQDTTKKKAAQQPSDGTSKENVSPKPAGFAIDDAGVPNEKKDNAPANVQKVTLPVKPVITPAPSSGTSNFAIDDAGVPNEKNTSKNKAAGTNAPKTKEVPKNDSIPK